ncbi:hypothetical protein Ancab_003127 [Ancistrocladus abbreviatus]
MGCGLSKKQGSVSDLVSLCRERTKLMKMAVKQRRAFAEAHSKYIHSLSSVSSAVRLFLALYSSPPSAFLVTLPSSPTTQIKHEPLNSPQQPSYSAISSDSSEAVRGKEGDSDDEEEEEDEATVCEFFYGDKSPGRPPMPSPERGNGWDFFNLFESHNIETVKLVTEREGIPEFEEDTKTKRGDRNRVMKKKSVDAGNYKNGVQDGGEVKGKKVTEKKKNGRELLEALKVAEDHFVRAYESGLDLSRMLEVNKLHQQSGLEETKGNPVDTIAWHQSISTQSSPCKSLLSYSSKTSSTWTECRSDLFDGCGGMQSGCHSFTLGRLYAWEKKLFEEVKALDRSRKSYQQKCSQLRKKGAAGDNLGCSKARDEVTDLYNRILITRRSTESISKQIEKLRDEELHPQLVELLHGLTRTWKIMLESHEIQAKTMSQVNSFTSPASGKFSHHSCRVATLELEDVLHGWNTSFLEYMATQKAYIKSVHGWLSKLTETEPQFKRKAGPSMPPFQMGVPTLLITCQSWLSSLERLPDSAVKCAMKRLVKNVCAMGVQQGKEQLLTRKVDELTKEMDRRAQELQQEEVGDLAMKKTLLNKVRNGVEYLSERRDSMDQMRKRLDLEKVKHRSSMEETKRVTLAGLGMGFSTVFESLIDFSRASVKVYGDLVTYCENASGGNEGQSYML